MASTTSCHIAAEAGLSRKQARSGLVTVCSQLKASSFRGHQLSSTPIAARRSPCRNLVVRAGFGDVAKYLSEAASSVFSPASSEVPWSGTSSGFQGKVTHHEVARLRTLYNQIKATREQVHPWPLQQYFSKVQCFCTFCSSHMHSVIL